MDLPKGLGVDNAFAAAEAKTPSRMDNDFAATKAKTPSPPVEGEDESPFWFLRHFLSA